MIQELHILDCGFWEQTNADFGMRNEEAAKSEGQRGKRQEPEVSKKKGMSVQKPFRKKRR